MEKVREEMNLQALQTKSILTSHSRNVAELKCWLTHLHKLHGFQWNECDLSMRKNEWILVKVCIKKNDRNLREEMKVKKIEGITDISSIGKIIIQKIILEWV